jgi:hypothetical protein
VLVDVLATLPTRSVDGGQFDVHAN